MSLSPPYIQHFQKPDTIGRTNVDKRWQDFQNCGFKTYRDGNLDLNTRYPGMTSEQVSKRRKSIEACIDKKGYIFIKTTPLSTYFSKVLVYLVFKISVKTI